MLKWCKVILNTQKKARTYLCVSFFVFNIVSTYSEIFVPPVPEQIPSYLAKLHLRHLHFISSDAACLIQTLVLIVQTAIKGVLQLVVFLYFLPQAVHIWWTPCLQPHWTQKQPPLCCSWLQKSSLPDEKHVPCRDLIRENILEKYETFDIFNLHILNEHSSSRMFFFFWYLQRCHLAGY